jgi:hypothetical protein
MRKARSRNSAGYRLCVGLLVLAMFSILPLTPDAAHRGRTDADVLDNRHRGREVGPDDWPGGALIRKLFQEGGTSVLYPK